MELNLTRPLAFFDLETTGIKVATDRIVEICVVKVFPDNTSKTWLRKINPGVPIPPEVTAIHGITDEDVRDAPGFRDIAHELLQFLENCDLAGYNSNHFDIPLLAEEFLRADVDFELRGRKFIDVQNIFHKMEPRNLKAAFKFYCGKDLENHHSAEADTIATYEILKAQLDKYNQAEITDKKGKPYLPVQNNVQALSEFSYTSRNVDLIGHIIYNDKKVEVFNFGKHKGKSVMEVFEKEPSYYNWMMDSEFPLSTKKVITQLKLRLSSNKLIL